MAPWLDESCKEENIISLRYAIVEQNLFLGREYILAISPGNKLYAVSLMIFLGYMPKWWEKTGQ